MHKIKIIGLLIVLSLFVSACSFKNPFSKKPQPTTGSVDTSELKDIKSEDLDNSFDVEGNLYDLWNEGKDIKCTYVFEENKIRGEGILYISKDKVRNDINMQNGEMKFGTSALVDKEWVYIWGDGMPKGMKLGSMDFGDKQPESDESPVDDQETNETSEELEKSLTQKYKYNCKEWDVDASKFELPKDIEFVDQSKMLEDLKDMEDKLKSGDTESLCGLCVNLGTASEIAQCKESLSCKE